MHSIDKDGGPTWRATSSSGGTQPCRIVGRIVGLLFALFTLWNGGVHCYACLFVWFLNVPVNDKARSISQTGPKTNVCQFHVLPHTRQSGETMTSVSAGHIISLLCSHNRTKVIQVKEM